MTKKELQEKYLQIQLLDQENKKLQQDILTLEQQILELKSIENSLDYLQKKPKNTKLFSSLGLGIYIETSLKDNKEVLVNVGSNVIVKKSIPEAKEILKHNSLELKETIKNLQEQLNKNIYLIETFAKEIENLKSKLKKK